jgi:hypothetical protein
MTWLIPFLIAAFWCFMCLMFSFISGWRVLAERYKAAESTHGRAFFMKSGKVGQISYRSCLNVCVSDEGMFLSVFPLFRLGHSPLFIPWIAISSREDKKLLWLKTVKLGIGAPRIATIELPKSVLS